jgi:hypothetical protein
MCGAIPPLPQYVIMQWCSVKKTQGELLPFTCMITLQSLVPGNNGSELLVTHLESCLLSYTFTIA